MTTKKKNTGISKTLHSINARTSPNDKIMTPKELAKKIIDSVEWEDGEIVLDSCRGEGSFYNQLPNNVNKIWCEIDEGKDFYNCNELLNTIIQNPPYSHLNNWFDKCKELNPKRMCFLLHMYALTDTRIKNFENVGYIIYKLDITKVHEWFGHQVVVWFGKKEIYGNSIIGNLGRYKRNKDGVYIKQIT